MKIKNYLREYLDSLTDSGLPLWSATIVKDGKAISLIEANGIIKAKIYASEHIYYQAYIPNTMISKIKEYIIK